MAAIKCEQCGKMISDKAYLCPYCDHTIRRKTNPLARIAKMIGLVFAGLIGIIVFFIVVVAPMQDRSTQAPPEKAVSKKKVVKKERPKNCERPDWRNQEDTVGAYIVIEKFVKKTIKISKYGKIPWHFRRPRRTCNLSRQLTI